MSRFTQKLIVVFLFVFALSSFYSCAHKEPVDIIDTEAEIWELQITGDTEGKLKMMLTRERIEKDIYSIAGNFSGRIKDHIGGTGELQCKLRGKIEKNIFLGDFAGPADMGVMSVYVQGTMKGAISKSQGFGTWSLTHQAGSSAGEWAIKIIKPCQ
jgi:hypothetical protein